MPKMKTHSGAKKRIKVTGTGRLLAQAVRQGPLQARQGQRHASVVARARSSSNLATPRSPRSSWECEGPSMARVKRGVQARKAHKKVLDRAKGYKGARSRRFRTANEQVMHAMQDAYKDRRDRKGQFRRLWIARINAAARAERDELQHLHGRPQGRRESRSIGRCWPRWRSATPPRSPHWSRWPIPTWPNRTEPLVMEPGLSARNPRVQAAARLHRAEERRAHRSDFARRPPTNRGSGGERSSHS